MYANRNQTSHTEMVSKILDKFEVTAAYTMLEGKKLAKLGDYALIIIDYVLPDGNGAVLCSSIRASDARTPILFITGASNFTETDARRLGGNGLVHKGNALFNDRLRECVQDLAIH